MPHILRQLNRLNRISPVLTNNFKSMKKNGQKIQMAGGFLKIPLRMLLLTSILFTVHTNSSAQNVAALDVKNVSFKDLFLEIQKQTDLSFVFNADQLKDLGTVSIAVKNEDLSRVLNRVLGNTPMTYSIEGRTIVIMPRDKSNARAPQPQGILIKGKITDEKGNPLIGATIKIKDTAIGTATDVNGEYQFTVPAGTTDLQVTYIGYMSQNILLNGRTVVNITLKEDTQEMEEVVVTGYQEIKRERMTGSTSVITANELRNKGLQSMDEIFNGTISGVSSVASGRPGEKSRILIRGVNSLTGSTDPIWIVDGMPLQGEIPNIKVGTGDIQASIFDSGVGNIAPDDIESVTILKDAAASAIYGARAANGVIVVKTKSGNVGKTVFNVSLNFGIKERPVNNIDMMNTAQKIQFEKEAYSDYGNSDLGRVSTLLNRAEYGIISRDEADKAIARLQETDTDWFKELFRTALTSQVNFSMSGGTEKTLHYLSLNYLTEKGTQLNNKYNRLRMNMKMTHTPVKQVKITGGLAATLKNENSSASVINPPQYAMYANPYESPDSYDLSYDQKSSSIRDGMRWDHLNVIDDLKRNTNSNRYLDAELSLKAEWEIIPGLTFTTHGIYNANSNHNRIIEGSDTYTNFINNWYTYDTEVKPENVRGSLKEATGYTYSYTFRNTLQYDLTLADKHYISLFAGQEISDRTGYNSFNYSPVFDESHRIIGFPEMEGVASKDINFSLLGNTGKSVSKLSSFFLNGSYSYMDRYVISGAIRYDGSDIIGNDNQFTPLWNVAGRWNIHNEAFFHADWFNELSLRVGYGYTGSIDKNALPFVVMNIGQSVLYDGITIPSSFNYSNPNVKWQTKQDRNIGLDMSMFKRRVDLRLNYYNNITRDVLDQKALAASSGRNTVTENVANITNRGIEADLSVVVIRKPEFQWSVKANIAYNHNELSKTYYKKLEDLPARTPENANAFVEGYPVGGWFGYQFAGVDPSTGHTMIYTGNGNETLDMEILRNVTLGVQIPAPSYLGEMNPPINGGFATSVNWKRFILSANFEFKTGHMIKSFNTFRTIDSRNRHVSDINRWRQAGDVTNIPGVSTVSDAYSKYMHDITLEKGDYLRCTFLSLGYNLDSRLLSKIGFSSARLSFTAKDLFTVTGYKGIDPALMGAFGYPNSRKYTITLNVGF